MSRRVIAVLVAAMTAALPTLARADGTQYDTRIIAVKNAPVEVTRCTFDSDEHTVVGVANRTSLELLSFKIRYYIYDQSNALIGQAQDHWDLNEPLDSGDQTVQKDWVMESLDNLGEPRSAVGHVSCRIEDASFTARRTWRYGERWKGKLLPLQSSMIDAAGSSHRGSFVNSGVHTKPNATLRVLAAWNDTSTGMTIVHDRIAITASSAPATIKPIDVVLRMRMQNGQTLSLPALGTSAPTYMKFNPVTGSDEATPEVDPSTDLGALGSVTVPQGGTAVVVATFVIPGAAANPDDNKQVALR